MVVTMELSCQEQYTIGESSSLVVALSSCCAFGLQECMYRQNIFRCAFAIGSQGACCSHSRFKYGTCYKLVTEIRQNLWKGIKGFCEWLCRQLRIDRGQLWELNALQWIISEWHLFVYVLFIYVSTRRNERWTTQMTILQYEHGRGFEGTRLLPVIH